MILRLQGGLGNQLFQLLALRYLGRLSSEEREIFVGDIDSFRTKRQLAISELLQGETIINKVGSFDQLLFRSKLSRALAPFGIHSIESVSQLSNWRSQYLNGYFQDIYAYKDLKLVKGLIGHIWQAISAINTCYDVTGEQCAIHLRLTDFVASENQRKFLVNYRLPYMKKAIQWFRDHGIQHFILFTDAPREAKMLLAEDSITLFSENCKQDVTLLQEFQSLSSFRNMIASNSTFSFWAALLGKSEKIVFPETWDILNKKDDLNFQLNLRTFNRLSVNNKQITRI